MDTQEPPIRPDGLQIAEAPAFQNAFWKVERVAWVGFALIIILAVLGLTGSGGPLSETTTRIGTAQVTYTQVMRWQTGGQIEIAVPDIPAETLTVAFDNRHSRHFMIDAISPEPEQVVLAADRHVYRVTTLPGKAGVIVFDVTARAPGMAQFELTVGDESRPLTVWILP